MRSQLSEEKKPAQCSKGSQGGTSRDLDLGTTCNGMGSFFYGQKTPRVGKIWATLTLDWVKIKKNCISLAS